jgi:DNA-binding MurR/RpiR family transcriptional regulator
MYSPGKCVYFIAVRQSIALLSDTGIQSEQFTNIHPADEMVVMSFLHKTVLK